MIANYHAYLALHGRYGEYVEKGHRGRPEDPGFFPITPMPYANGYVSNVKMRLNQLEGYVDTVLNLKKEYEKDIEIHLGLEVEYYPKYFKELLHITGQYPIEYFLLPSIFSEMRSTMSTAETRPRIRRFWSAIVCNAARPC